jgi:hypothetical protein
MHRYHDGTYTRDVLISEGKTGKIDKFMVILLFGHNFWLKPRTPITITGSKNPFVGGNKDKTHNWLKCQFKSIKRKINMSQARK